MKRILQTIALSAVVSQVAAVTVSTTITETYHVSTTIADNSLSGFSDTRSVVGSGIKLIGEVKLSLAFAGGWNGDLYAYLVHGSGFAVLLNRPGRGTAVPFGAGSSGMNILFDDGAPLDVHLGMANSGFAAGTFQPDGRMTHPLVTDENSPRTAFLSSFDGLAADGDWTLFVADVSPGDESTLESWSLIVTGVPEPSQVLLVSLSLVILIQRRQRRD
jgi:subtilisin-like proprotein convertase family protein